MKRSDFLPNRDPEYIRMKDMVDEFNSLYLQYMSLVSMDFLKIGKKNVHVINGSGDKPYMFSVDGKTEFSYDVQELIDILKKIILLIKKILINL